MGIDLKEREHVLIKDFSGIVPYHEVFYIRSIMFSAKKSITSFNSFWQQLQESESDPENIVYDLYEALAHAATISRYFWPSHNKKRLHSSRGLKLRNAFTLNDNNPLKDRQLRDTIEHFDERLDKFLLNDPIGHIFDLIITDQEILDNEATYIFRLVDPTRGIVVLFGEKYNFISIQKAVHDIYGKAIQMDSNGGKLNTHKS